MKLKNRDLEIELSEEDIKNIIKQLKDINFECETNNERDEYFNIRKTHNDFFIPKYMHLGMKDMNKLDLGDVLLVKRKEDKYNIEFYVIVTLLKYSQGTEDIEYTYIKPLIYKFIEIIDDATYDKFIVEDGNYKNRFIAIMHGKTMLLDDVEIIKREGKIDIDKIGPLKKVHSYLQEYIDYKDKIEQFYCTCSGRELKDCLMYK